jgi:hypothetical protein
MYNPLGWHLQYLTYCIGNVLPRRPELETSLALILTWLFVLDKPVSCVHAVTVNPLLVDFTRLYQLRQDGGSFRITVSKYARNQKLMSSFYRNRKESELQMLPQDKKMCYTQDLCMSGLCPSSSAVNTTRRFGNTSGI